MIARGLGRTAARISRSLDLATAKARAAEFGHRLKAEYEAGKADITDEPDEAVEAAEAEAVAEAMRGVDWAKVKAATSEKGADAAQAMKSMAAEVDWAKVQPMAAKVSSALIAAVASGQLGVGGRYAAPVARAIMNDRNLAQRVGATLDRDTSTTPPDFRGAISEAIDTTATE